MNNTTKINPGAFKKYKPKSLLSIVKRQLRLLLNLNLLLLKNSIKVDYINWYNFSFKKNNKINFICPVCKHEGSSFVHFYNKLGIAWNSSCPNCDSRSRHRGLSIFYKDFLYAEYQLTKRKLKIIHFAPEPILVDIINQSFASYKTSDLFLQDVDFPGEDIQKLSFENDSFDVVLCNHVIEHVPDDFRALKEIQRVLSDNGKLLLTIPGDYSRKNTIYFKDLTNNGHYRDYGWDIVERLNTIFSKVNPIDMKEFNNSVISYGIRDKDYVFVCTK